MSTRRERWLRTSCPVSDPAQTGVRRQYENARQQVRLARWYQSTGECAWAERMEDSALATLERLERARSSLCKDC